MGVVRGVENEPKVNTKNRSVSWSELAKHNTENDCWIAIEDQVYDITAFSKIHPGGLDNILLASGRECTSLFVSYHPLWVWNSYKSKLAKYYIGELVADKPEEVSPHNKNITDFYLGMKKVVEQHFKKNKIDPRVSFDMAFRIPVIILSILVLHYLALHVIESFWLAMVVSLMHGIASALLCLTGVHEASHSAVSGKPSLWKIIGAISHNFINGANFHIWQNQHIVGHHLLTNVHEGDPDIAGDLFRFSPNQPWLSSHSLQYITAPFAYGLLSFRTRVRDLLVFMDGSSFGYPGFNFGRKSTETTLLIASKVFFFTYRYLIPLYYGLSFWRLLVLTVASDMLGSAYLAFLFQCNHVVLDAEFPVAGKNGEIAGDWGKMQLATTQDYGHDSYWTYFFTGALNYQVTHHLFPYVSQAHYRKLAPVIKDYCKKHGVKYVARKDVFEAGRAHLGMLHKLAQDPKKAN